MVGNLIKHLGNYPKVAPLALRPREAAKMLGISERTLFSWTRDGIVPSAKVGRTVLYSVEHLRAWLDRQAAQSTAQRVG